MTSPLGLDIGCGPQSALDSIWLGKPGSMAALPRPDSGVAAPLTRGATGHALMDGGTTVTRRPTVKRIYALSWSQIDADSADALLDFYGGRAGVGPFVLVDPNWRNHCDYAKSTMGGAQRQNTVWRITGNTLALLDTAGVAAPTGVRSDVLVMPTPAVSATLWPADLSGGYVVNAKTAVPWLPGSGCKISLWVRSRTGSAGAGQLYACGAAAATGLWSGTYTVTSAVTNITTTWQRLSLDLSATAWTQAQVGYVEIAFQVTTAPAADLLFAGAQIEYSNKLGPFVQGIGCPRVSIGPDAMGNANTVWWRRNPTLTLVER